MDEQRVGCEYIWPKGCPRGTFQQSVQTLDNVLVFVIHIYVVCGEEFSVLLHVLLKFLEVTCREVLEQMNYGIFVAVAQRQMVDNVIPRSLRSRLVVWH